ATRHFSSFCFQAEDGIRDRNVTGVQTCALPIFGIGMRISIHPHSDDYERIILEALETTSDQLHLTGLEITTGEVSTYVGVKTGEIGRASCRERVYSSERVGEVKKKRASVEQVRG